MERRSKRSRAPELATRFYLLAVSRRHSVNTLVLADERGDLLAGVESRPFMGDGRVAVRVNERTGRALAESGALLCAQAEPSWRGRVLDLGRRVRLALRRRRTPAPLVAHPFEAGDRRFVLVSTAEDAARNALTDAADGLRRILQQEAEAEAA